MVFFERFDYLARQHNTSPNAVAKELGISSGSVTAWKNGTAPLVDKAILLAAHFNVTTDYLLGVEGPASVPYVSPGELALLKMIRKLPPDKRKALEILIK